MRALCLGLLLLVAAAPALANPANPLLGSWKSDRQLTLDRLSDKVRPDHRKEIEAADLGNAVVEFRDKEYTWTLGSQTRRLPYRILEIRGKYVDIEYFQHPAQTSPSRMTLFVSGDLLYTPVREFNFYEVFKRLPVPAKAQDAAPATRSSQSPPAGPTRSGAAR